MALVLQFVILPFIFSIGVGVIFVVIWVILIFIFCRCGAFSSLACCAFSVFFVILGVTVVKSCVPLQVVEVSCSHSYISRSSVVYSSRIISVTCFASFPIRFVVCGVIIIVFIGAAKESTAVAVLHINVIWVPSHHPLHSAEYILWVRKRREFLTVDPTACAEAHKIVRPL